MHKERDTVLNDQKDRCIYIPTTIDNKNHCSGTADQWFQRRKNESEMKPLLTFKGCNLLVLLVVGANNHKQQAAAAFTEVRELYNNPEQQ